MRIKNKLIDISLKLQNFQINGNLEKILYFGTKILFTGPILIGIFQSHSKIFQKLEIKKQITENLVSFLVKQSLILEPLLTCLIAIILGSFYAIYKIKNELVLTFTIWTFLLFESTIYLTTWIWMLTLRYEQIRFASKILFTLVLAQVYTIWVLIQKSWISFGFRCQNPFFHKSNKIVFILNCIQKLLFIIKCYFIQMDTDNIFISSIVNLAIILIYCSKLVRYLKEKYYVDQTLSNIEIYGILLSIVYFAIVQISTLLNLPMIEENQLVISLTIAFFAIFSAEVYLKNKQAIYHYLDAEEIIEGNLVIPYIDAQYKLWINANTNQSSIIIASLKKNHSYSCKKNQCFCKNITFKGSLQENSAFLKGYYLQIIDRMSSPTSSFQVKIKILNFKFQVFRNVLNIAKQINLLNLNDNLSFQTTLGLKNLSQKIFIYINRHLSQQGDIDFQLPLKLDQTLISLQKIILSQIDVKNNKWQYLSRSICKSMQIEADIVKEIGNIIQFQKIYHEKKVIYKKSLSFNALSLFYYLEIVFLKKQVKSLEANLAQITEISNFNFINNHKQLSKNIFDPRCCVLEINLSERQINQNFSFLITECNRNTQTIFKYRKEIIIQKSLSQFYPNIIWSQMKSTLLNFLNQNQQQFHSLTLDCYFLDKFHNLFKGYTCIKVVPKMSGVCLALIIFQKQTDKTILLDKNNFILNVGQTFKKYFGNIYQGLPFQSLFYNQHQYHNLKVTEKPITWNCSLIYGTQIGKQWRLYTQNIKSYLMKKKINAQREKGTVSIKSMSTTRKRINTEISDFLTKQKQKLMSKRIVSQSSQQKTEQITVQNKNKSVLSISFNCKKCNLNDLTFVEINFQAIKRKRTDTQKPQILNSLNLNEHILSQMGKPLTYQNDLNSLIYQSHDLFSYIDEFQEQQLKSVQSEQEGINKQMKEKYIQEKNSIKSSVRGQQMTYFYTYFVDICFNLFKNPQEIYDRRLNNFTGGSLLISLTTSILIILTYVIFKLGLYQIKDIFFANGAVSDNLSLTQFMYNRGMNFKQYKNDNSQLPGIMQSAQFQRQQLFKFIVYDMHQFVSAKTSMTNKKFYEYLKVPVVWKSRNTETQTIQSSQLILFYYYLSREVELNIAKNDAESSRIIIDALNKMKDNFPELQRINNLSTVLYKDMSDRSLALIQKLIQIFLLAHLLLSLILLFIFYRQKLFRRKQQIQGYSIYKLIPHHIIDILSNYFRKRMTNIKSSSDLLKYQTHFQKEQVDLPTNSQAYLKSNNSTFITNNLKSPLAVWRMVFVLLGINLVYGSVLLNVNILTLSIEKMMNNVNDLISSENNLFESYFQLKTSLLIQEKFTYNQTFFDRLLQRHQSAQVLFNKIAIQSLGLFANYDSTYTTDFINLLINDTCQLAKQKLDPKQYEKCKGYFKIKILENGVIMGMNFFSRKMKNTILMLKQKLNNTSSINLSEDQKTQLMQTFLQLDFRQIDESIIFMFKMYQATQARILLSLQKTIDDLMNFSFIMILAELLIIGIGYPLVLYKNYKNEKYQLSKLYVSFLLIPSPVSKMIKSFAGTIEQVLQYDNNL